MPGQDKEEKEMGEEDLAAKMHMLRQREQEQEKRDNAVEDLKKEVKNLCKLFPGLCEEVKQLKEAKTDEKNQTELRNEIKEVKGMVCDPVTGKCWLPTKSDLAKIQESIPKIMGGHQDMSSLFRHLDEGNDPNLDEAVQGRIPASLKVKWVKEWCKDGECRTLLEKDGFEVEDDDSEKERHGMLGRR